MRYTKEHDNFIREIAPGRYNDEIAELFNAKFGTNLSSDVIRGYKSRNKIKSNVPRNRATEDGGLFTKEQKEFIKNNVKGLLNQELAELVSKTFNLSITARQMNTYKKNHRLTSGIDSRFQKGQEPFNKGKKFPGKTNRTSFVKGQKSHNYKPVGYERIDKDGYVLVKIQDDGPWHKRWRHKHKVIWEKVNGPLPHGHKLLFADGNKENVSLENLILVSNRQLLAMNRNDLIQSNPELTKTGLIIADLYNTMHDRKKKVGESSEA